MINSSTRNSRLARVSKDLLLFASASMAMGMAYSMFDSIFNNFLNSQFTLTGFQRSFLEVPRELPGFLVVFVSAALSFLCSRRLGAVALVLGIIGTILIGFFSATYAIMVIWLFIYSMGQHLLMPISSSIGMDMAREGQVGRRLGQLNAVRNLAAILGSFLVVMGFKYLGFNFNVVFILCAISLTTSAILMFSMKPNEPLIANNFLKLHSEYRIYYLLAVLSGSRKQLFITFAPWVLVTIFQQPTQLMATLLMIGGIIGILFQPLLGWTIDHLGERFVLAAEAIILIFVCLGYGFSKDFFVENIAFILVCCCYLVDQMLMSVGMARSTYIKKIALQPSDVQPALTAAVTIDHVFSITAALLGGIIWNRFGFQYVFLMGVLIAVLNLVVALQVKIPKEQSALA